MGKLWLNKKLYTLMLFSTLAFCSCSYVGKMQLNYQVVIKSVDDDLEDSNDNLLKLISDLKISKVNFTSVGNSIGLGYSAKDEIVPLLLRNDDLIKRLNESGIESEYHQFARAQDNCDEHTYNMLLNNVNESEVNERIHVDFRGEGSGMDADTITDKNLDKYFPLTVLDDQNLNNIISNTANDEMNIVVYSGGTGSFLDNMTRKSEDLSNAFDRDLSSVEAFFKSAYLTNPKTQIYFCGLPNYFNVGITEIQNNKYREMIKFYPNVTYVEPAPAKVFYGTAEGTVIDIHYDKNEYRCLNKNIVNAICQNYLSNAICIDLHIAMRALNEHIQFKNSKLRNNEDVLKLVISTVLGKYTDLNTTNKDLTIGLTKFTNIYKTRYGYDYYYTSKAKTLAILEDYTTSLKQPEAAPKKLMIG